MDFGIKSMFEWLRPHPELAPLRFVAKMTGRLLQTIFDLERILKLFSTLLTGKTKTTRALCEHVGVCLRNIHTTPHSETQRKCSNLRKRKCDLKMWECFALFGNWSRSKAMNMKETLSHAKNRARNFAAQKKFFVEWSRLNFAVKLTRLDVLLSKISEVANF